MEIRNCTVERWTKMMSVVVVAAVAVVAVVVAHQYSMDYYS